MSGIRFSVEYFLFGEEEFARMRAEEICVEQTIEFPPEFTSSDFIKDSIIGQIVSFIKVSDKKYSAIISYAIEESGFNLPQLMNVIYGGISMKTGVRVNRLDFPKALLRVFKGPRFGVNGIRNLIGIEKRPLLLAVVKPMGAKLNDLANLAFQYALGGIDIIKDDHGLANLSYCPFKERVLLCVDAIQKANNQTRSKSLYFACLTVPFGEILEAAFFAKSAGVDGLLILPGIVGMDTMRMLAENDDLGLPIMYHPAFHGSYVMGTDYGFSKFSFFGQLMRIAGADFSIFVNFGSRFSFSKDECIDIARGCSYEMENIKSIFPTPGGGLTFNLLQEMIEVYDKNVVYLMGSGLFKRGPDIVKNCRELRTIVESIE